MIYGKYKVWREGYEEWAEFFKIDSPKHAAAAFLERYHLIPSPIRIVVRDKVSLDEFDFYYQAPNAYDSLVQIGSAIQHTEDTYPPYGNIS